MLAAPLARSRATIFFSATLLPMDYFMQLLTGAAQHPWLVFQSPFPLENVSLLVHKGIANKYAQRDVVYAEVDAEIKTTCIAEEG